MKQRAQRWLGWALRRWALLSRPMTLGVRLLAYDEMGRVFLVRHAYRDGWYLPGGAVDPGETAVAAARREAEEEGHLLCETEPRLVAVFYNRREGRDHVLLYRCDRVRQPRPRRPDREIAETGFFAQDALPEGATPATRRRIDEDRTGMPRPEDW
ncbi:DNA mismatch repair protein MutT [Aureimonas ureilytica]|uniref:DNA mismatch repair protein MutT n=1 Tax=Aureimonas ureilytica TaxID=401562 RepID=A0A175RIU7_9HYPH|nr:NUDIX domain-containing protein [Aureimonas ureilytica]KTR03331.1 DNA mismatch repair protein MutT [Aureimonas ureilytica]